MHDLLSEPLIGVRTCAGDASISLPELLAGLVRGDVVGYTGMRAHQSDPWHVFLMQVAASVLARHPEVDPARAPDDAAFWHRGLLDLAAGQATAWELVVDDPSRPAFMQHPLAGGANEMRSAFKPKATTPDELDVLVTAKDHDLKMARARPDSSPSWLFALVTYQTTSGFLGQGNYGTVRMNGGFASRPIVAMIGSRGPAQRFREELEVLRRTRADVIAAIGYQQRGVVLTWAEAWPRTDHQYLLGQLEPWFIEAVRPLRLVRASAGILALAATSKARQIGPKALDSGLVGDPWIPLNVADKKKGKSALTLAAAGWTPDRLTHLLFEQGYELTPMQRNQSGNDDRWFIGSSIVRGQGTTDGYHEFRIRVPGKVRRLLIDPRDAQPLGEFARERLKDAAAAARALRTALMALVEGGPESVDLDKKAVVGWADAAGREANSRWHDRYFPALWGAADAAARDAVTAEWKAALFADAREALRHAEQSLPTASARRWRAITKAGWLLQATFRKAGLLPDTVQTPEEDSIPEETA